MAHFCAAATGPSGRSAWSIIPPPLTLGVTLSLCQGPRDPNRRPTPDDYLPSNISLRNGIDTRLATKTSLIGSMGSGFLIVSKASMMVTMQLRKSNSRSKLAFSRNFHWRIPLSTVRRLYGARPGRYQRTIAPNPKSECSWGGTSSPPRGVVLLRLYPLLFFLGYPGRVPGNASVNLSRISSSS